MDMHPPVFSAAWFARHQRALLLALRTPVIGRELRAALGIRLWDCGYDAQIVALRPDSYTVRNPDGTFTSDFRTHHKYAKRLHRELLPLWRAAHEWDRFLANPLCPALNLGFDTLTMYPDPSSGATSCDGYFGTSISGDETWDALHADVTHASVPNVTDEFWICAFFRNSGTSNQFSGLIRSGFTFDTSILTSGAYVSDAAFSLYGKETYTGSGSAYQDDLGWNGTISVYAFSPALPNTFNAADYVAYGTTPFSTPKAGSAWAMSYNTWTLNDFGLAALNKTGVSAFGVREATYDVANVNPNTVGWFAFAQLAFWSYYADQAGTVNDPKLTVTYSMSPPPPKPFRTAMISRGRR